jgi:hypothetical protein
MRKEITPKTHDPRFLKTACFAAETEKTKKSEMKLINEKFASFFGYVQ